MVKKSPEQIFSETFHALAVVCKFDLDEEGRVYEMYDRALEPLGYERVNQALQKIFEERDSNDPFPSIKQIKAVMNESLSPEDQGPLIAGKILEAIVKIGPHRHHAFIDFVGPVGWRVVQMSGGLESVCQMQDRDIASNRGQWTKLATSILRSGMAALPSLDAKRIEGPNQGEHDLKPLSGLLEKLQERKDEK